MVGNNSANWFVLVFLARLLPGGCWFMVGFGGLLF